MKNTLRLLTLIALILSSPIAFASHHDIFVGDFSGVFTPPDDDKGNVSDLSVSIHEIDGGLNISWITSTTMDDASKGKNYSIDFIETDREHIYKAAQKKNLFGGRDPLDPMKGEPYAWARIKDQTLTVYMMLITEEGGFDMQTYSRTLTENGELDTQISRVRNTEVMKTIDVILKQQTTSKPEKNK